MQLKCYSIRDLKGEMFNPPFYQKTHGEAERTFRTLVSDEKSTLHKYPEDFELFCLGEFNDQTGRFQSLESPQAIIHGLEAKQPRQ